MRLFASRRLNQRTVILVAASLLAVPLATGPALPAAAATHAAALAAAHAAPKTSQANTWTPTAGPMSVARSGQTATLLPNGKVLIVGGSSAAADLYDPATGTFTPTGSMSMARPGATATLLKNGQVLVAGGCCNGNKNLASAELYNPATGKWTTTGSMVHPRSLQTATLLPNGQVLVAGGACNGTAYGCDTGSFWAAQASAELYNPATGKWTATASMPAGRDMATATLLPNGQVLATGGLNNCDDTFCTDLKEADLYNPATGKWTRTGSMHSPREQHTATLLPNGQVLTAGGFNEGGFSSGGGAEASAELYNPATGTWTKTASMPITRYGHTATLLKNGWVLVTGGQTASATIFEPSHGLWVSPGSMSTARTGHTATLLGNGHVLVTGGTGPDGKPQATAEVFLAGPGPLVQVTPTSLSFGSQQVGSTGSAHSYTVTNEGSTALTITGLAVSGANPGDFAATSDCTKAPLGPGASCTVSARFAPTATGLRQAQVGVSDNAPLSPQGAAVSGFGAGPNVFAPTGAMKAGRDLATATLLPSGKVLIAGGEQSSSEGIPIPLSEAELYNPATGTFTPTGSLITPRYWATAALLPDGQVLVTGGKGANFANLSSAELYDPATGKWTATGSMNSAGYGITSTLLHSGKVLVTDLGFSNDAELYDPATGKWTDTGPMVSSHGFGTATLLNNGQVLATGGSTATELYNPAANDWTATGSMNVARQYPTATLLPDGQVLDAGGITPDGGGPTLASAELYNPATGKWAKTGSMSTGRYGATATLLPDGKVIVAGGCAACTGTNLASTEIYSNGFWSPGPSMSVTRYDQTATLLANGNLLIAGGGVQYCCSVTAGADLLTPALATVSPTHGPAGQAITVSGSGFFAGEQIRVTLDATTLLGRVTTAVNGSFVLHTKIPAGTAAGQHTIDAAGQKSGAGASVTFTVT
jgi:N-acetylneuraminic acid mutarotase